MSVCLSVHQIQMKTGTHELHRSLYDTQTWGSEFDIKWLCILKNVIHFLCHPEDGETSRNVDFVLIRDNLDLRTKQNILAPHFCPRFQIVSEAHGPARAQRWECSHGRRFTTIPPSVPRSVCTLKVILWAHSPLICRVRHYPVRFGEEAQPKIYKIYKNQLTP